MPVEDSSSVPIQQYLETLGLTLLSEWDALVFLYRHGNSLVSTAAITQLLGNNKNVVMTALNRLEAIGFLTRSRGSGGIRLYRFTVPSDAARYLKFKELMDLAGTRNGRILLLKHLASDHALTAHRRGRLHLA